MPLWIDDKYMRLLAPHLDQFKAKGGHAYNFRCPLCGDSEKNKFKARGYVFPKRDMLMMKCHNCGIALPFEALLKRVARHLYNDYALEQLKELPQKAAPEPPPAPVALKSVKWSPTLTIPLSALLEPSHALHEVYRFIVNRMIPATALSRLYATNKARTWLLPLLTAGARTLKETLEAEKKLNGVTDGEPFLIQPLKLTDGTWYGAQIRTIAQKEFYTFRWSHAPLKMFGLDVWKPNRLTYVVEGPLDALFVPNAISPLGSDLWTGVRVMKELGMPTDKMVYVWDNEPRNPQVVQHIKHAVSLHEPVVIWTRDLPKDINDMVRAGLDVNHVLPTRTFQGVAAEVELSQWLRG